MIIKPAYVSHSGEYVCEDEGGNRSKSVNISITAADVILVSPALPVVEGEAVSLSCRRKGSPSNLPADFYKDGSLIRTTYTGEMSIHSISASDGGFYKCSISGSQGESAESWLQVTGTTAADDPQTSPSPGSNRLLPVLTAVFTLTFVVVLLLVVGLVQCRKHRGPEQNAADPNDVTYSTVTAKRKREVSRSTNVSDPNKSTYAVIVPRKE
ncbi:low affinity immunoglobulin gamma Fc region receptor II-like [Betta splendens]|uniref:low affinity immunoglobulin gamma Fc region receptor II-like n=1 Tax=Betta splendens TaxID=158456 RepID=UPI00244DBD0B|nr:low affinity immunoglobulin gamma Fc region receptor II-like [Betta splendens]